MLPRLLRAPLRASCRQFSAARAPRGPAIVAGAANGVGAAVARMFAKHKLPLMLLDRDATGLERTRAECERDGSPMTLVNPLDLRDSSGLQNAIDTAAKEMGSLTNAVYCAGVFKLDPMVGAATKASWDLVNDVNTNAAADFARLCAPHLLKSPEPRRSLVLVASVGAGYNWFQAPPGTGSYTASKAGLRALVGPLMQELRDDNIKVSTISPGGINTEMSAHFDAEYDGLFSEVNREDRLEPTDVAHTIEYVVSAADNCLPTEIVLHHMKPDNSAEAEGRGIERKKIEARIKRNPVTPDRKSAFVSGGSRGVGRAMALSLAKEGYNLGILALPEHQDEMAEVEKQCKAFGVDVVTFPVNVLDGRGEIDAAINETAERFNGLDVYIASAGVNHRCNILRADMDMWNDMLNINLVSTMYGVGRALRIMYETRETGHVIIISSAGVVGQIGGCFQSFAPYQTSKLGLLGLANSAFEDVRGYGLKVSSIFPGLINTSLGTKRGPVFMSPPEEMVQPEDVADCAKFLLSTSKKACPTHVFLLQQNTDVDLFKRMGEVVKRKRSF